MHCTVFEANPDLHRLAFSVFEAWHAVTLCEVRGDTFACSAHPWSSQPFYRFAFSSRSESNFRLSW
jgi:hypothetical protein